MVTERVWPLGHAAWPRRDSHTHRSRQACQWLLPASLRCMLFTSTSTAATAVVSDTERNCPFTLSGSVTRPLTPGRNNQLANDLFGRNM